MEDFSFDERTDDPGIEMDEPKKPFPDWREPLCSYANSLSGRNSKTAEDIYKRLGNYAQAEEKLKAIREKAKKKLESAVQRVENADSSWSLESALNDLKMTEGHETVPESVLKKAEFRLKEFQKKEALAREEEARKERRKKTILFGAIAAVILAAVGWFIYYQTVTLPGYIRAGDEALAAGNYAEAISYYEKAEGNKTADAQIHLLPAKKQWADVMISEQNYQGAIDIYEGLHDTEKVNQIKTVWGIHARETGDYEKAIELFSGLGAASDVNSTYRKWSDSVAETGDYPGAIDIIKKADDSDEKSTRITELSVMYAETLAEEILALDTEAGTALAKSEGPKITDLSAQLLLCKKLIKAGYDMESIYPDGVAIENISLAKYQVEDLKSVKDSENEYESDLDKSKVLVFERREEDYPRDTASFTVRQHDKTKDSLYTIKLLPADMQAFGLSAFPDDLDSATVILIRDYLYLKVGDVYTESVPRNNNNSFYVPLPSSRTYYPVYDAVCALVAFDAENPEEGKIVYADSFHATAYDDDWFAKNKNSGDTVHQHRYLVGTWDDTDLLEYMQTLLLLFRLGIDL